MPRPDALARTEIHCHLLPGIDDGARDLDDSVEMATVAAADGTATILATPHVRSDFVTDVSILPELVAELRGALAHAGVGVDVHCSGELGHELVGRLGQVELETIASGPPGRRWLLVEAPFDGLGDEFTAASSELRARGFGVVIAHPERSPGFVEGHCESLGREIERGSLLQVNQWSLTGGHGAEAEAAALALLRQGLVAVLASDSHPGWRQPTLSVGAAAARAAGLGVDSAALLVTDRPARLVREGMSAQLGTATSADAGTAGCRAAAFRVAGSSYGRPAGSASVPFPSEGSGASARSPNGESSTPSPVPDATIRSSPAPELPSSGSG